MSPSDKLISFIPKGQEFVVADRPDGQMVVDSRDPKAMAWAKKVKEEIARNGGLTEANYHKIMDCVPTNDFPLGGLEMRPPAHATPADIKDANEFNIGIHGMAQVLKDVEGGKHFVDFSKTKPQAGAPGPKAGV